jgi:autotransporter-associated beta strand protein
VIRDNVDVNTMAITSVSSLTKLGTGALTLSGPNTYTGDTTVSAGVLGITTPYLGNGANVFLTTGATLSLTHSETDVIDSLFINGVSQVTGTWGSPTSSAANKSDFFSGNGLLQVTTFIAPPLLIGDYNSNGIVDAADYTVWRNALGTSTVLNNRDPANMGNVSQNDYASWKTNFGATLPGAGSLNSSGSVPEPVSLVMLLMGGGLWGASSRRR